MYQSTHTGAQVDEAVDKALSADAVPTAGSTNLVESGGVFGVMSNRNLLDNWYFVGGGSQRGGGQFPINQRGQASYSTSNAYCIDRWGHNGQPGTVVELVNDGVKLTNTTSNRAGIAQGFESGVVNFLTGKTCTISAIIDGVLYSATKPMFANNSAVSVGVLEVYAPTGSNSIILRLPASNPAKSVIVSAVKLELGSVSTLANDAPPNYAEELAKCQRYFVRISGYYAAYKTASTAVPYEFSIPFPVQMRAVPTISNVTYVSSSQASGYDASYSGMLRFYSTSGGFVVESFNASADL